MSVRWDVLGIGVSAVDDLVYVDQYPEPDSKLPVKRSLRQLGGVTAMALVAAARMGARERTVQFWEMRICRSS